MKKYSIIFLMSVFVFGGCQDILDEEPETFLSEDQVFGSEDGVETAVNGIYNSFSSPEYHGSAFHGLIMPHSGKFYSNQGASEDATSLNCTPINIWLTRLWPGTFETINVANVTIDQLENSTVPLANRDFALGQAYFLRAATYFDLVRWFGGVPLRLTPADSKTLHLPRSSRDEVYTQIIMDFQRAKELMPDFGEYRPERPVKWAAYMYLAKVYMTMATMNGNNDLQLWQKAYDEAIQVYGKYSLEPLYADVFDLNNENNGESIFEIQYGQNGAIRNSDVIRTYTPQNSLFAPENQVTFGRVKANKETFDSHQDQYPGDPRLDATYIYGSYEKTDGTTRTVYPERTNGNDGFAYIKKYIDPNYNGTTTNRNFIKLRYADLLLMLAEIENELNGPANAYQYVNEVLARARNTENGPAAQPVDYAGMTQDQFRERIMMERQYELLAEGHTWFDVRRRGYEYFLQHVIYPHNESPNFHQSTDFVYPVTVKNMLLPIPSDEISGNYEITQADQNPGY